MTTAEFRRLAARAQKQQRKYWAITEWRDAQLKPCWAKYQKIEQQAEQDYAALVHIPSDWDEGGSLSPFQQDCFAAKSRICEAAHNAYRKVEARVDAEAATRRRKVADMDVEEGRCSGA